MIEIDPEKYLYDLPEGRIAQHPVSKRDMSKLLICKGKSISSDLFINIGKYIPSGSLLLFNNTKVIKARLLFRKESGALIEILCLEPLSPSGYGLSLSSTRPVEWKCIIGNLKKWKGRIISGIFGSGDKKCILSAEKICQEGVAWRIRFSWDSPGSTFSEIIEKSGRMPIPPYINRLDTQEDAIRYQTVYSTVEGSVAAPTAGLHFTEGVLESISSGGIKKAELTLHVSAGTFQPVRVKNIWDHEMHLEHYHITRDTIELIRQYNGKIIPVGTTSVRTLESIYWLGVKFCRKERMSISNLMTGQWEPYEGDCKIGLSDSLDALLEIMESSKIRTLNATTGIMIIPGYKFRITNGIITNFHQPGSTLIMLVAAWLGENWRKVYNYALNNDFRFLSYGDSSLLFR